eukprot:UN27694
MVKYAVVQHEFAKKDTGHKITVSSKCYANVQLEYDDVDIAEGTTGVIVQIREDDLLVFFENQNGVFPVEPDEISISHVFQPFKDSSGHGLLKQVDSGIKIKYLCKMKNL